MAVNVTISRRDAVIARKIGAVQDKLVNEVDRIVAAQSDVPGLAKPYDAAAVRAWIGRRINLLQQLQRATNAQILNALQAYYDGLTAPQQAVADQILAGDYSSLPNLNATQFEIAVLVILYKTMAVADG